MFIIGNEVEGLIWIFNDRLQCSGMKTNIKSGIFCEIFKSKSLGDCSLGGVSANADTILLILDEGGPFTVEDAKQFGYPVCKLVKRNLGGTFGVEYMHIEPDSDGMWSAGGTIVNSCDSRFPCRYPVLLHDRDMRKE